MQKITPCLFFNGCAEEAVNFYLSVFKDSEVLDESRYGEGGHMPVGTVMTIAFKLNGQEFIALNGGAGFNFTEAISLTVYCETQEEVDHYWDKLSSDGGEEVECGWVKDKYGVFWQVVPSMIPQLISASDPARSQRVMNAVMQMRKLDIATLLKAAEG